MKEVRVAGLRRIPMRETLVVVVTVVFMAALSSAKDPGIVNVFFYGTPGDGYLGQRHAASWHERTPRGFPEVVDAVHHGIGVSDWSIPFGTILCLEVIAFPEWANGEYDSLIGNISCGVVTDRMAPWVESRLGPSVDVWPALARDVMGEDFWKIGTVTARVVYEGIGGGERL